MNHDYPLSSVMLLRDALFHEYNGSLYMLTLSPATWRKARELCHIRGFHLARIQTQQEHANIKAWLNSNLDTIRGYVCSHLIYEFNECAKEGVIMRYFPFKITK